MLFEKTLNLDYIFWDFYPQVQNWMWFSVIETFFVKFTTASDDVISKWKIMKFFNFQKSNLCHWKNSFRSFSQIASVLLTKYSLSNWFCWSSLNKAKYLIIFIFIPPGRRSWKSQKGVKKPQTLFIFATWKLVSGLSCSQTNFKKAIRYLC